MSDPWNFTTSPPTETGWYPVIVCYDVQEGLFPSMAYSDGKVWKYVGPIVAIGSAGPFRIKDEAEYWAYEHDPDK